MACILLGSRRPRGVPGGPSPGYGRPGTRVAAPAVLRAAICLLPFLLLRPLPLPSLSAATAASTRRIPASGRRLTRPVDRLGDLSARREPSARRAAWEGRARRVAGPRLPPLRGEPRRTAVLKREPEKEAEPGRGGESAGCPGTPPRLLREARARALGRSGLGTEGCYPQGGRHRRSSSWLRLLGDDPEGPWAAPAAPRILAPPGASRIPWPGASPGGRAAQVTEEGAPQAEVLENRAPQPQPSLEACPKGARRATPLAPLAARSPPSVPHCSQPIALRGKGEGVRALVLRALSLPSCLLAGGEREWGGACPRAPPPRPPAQLGSRSSDQGAGSSCSRILPCVLRATWAFQDGVDLGGTTGTETPPSAGAVGGGGAD